MTNAAKINRQPVILWLGQDSAPASRIASGSATAAESAFARGSSDSGTVNASASASRPGHGPPAAGDTAQQQQQLQPQPQTQPHSQRQAQAPRPQQQPQRQQWSGGPPAPTPWDGFSADGPASGGKGCGGFEAGLAAGSMYAPAQQQLHQHPQVGAALPPPPLPPRLESPQPAEPPSGAASYTYSGSFGSGPGLAAAQGWQQQGGAYGEYVHSTPAPQQADAAAWPVAEEDLTEVAL